MSGLRTPVCELLGIEHPIVGFAHDIATVAAISNAGGLGVYGATRRFPTEIRAELAELRERVGPRPFGVDLVLPPGMPEHDSRAAIEAHIPDEHRRFVASIVERYEVPPGSGPGMRTRFIRSTEIESAQIDAVLASDVDLFACGIGAPRAAVERAHDAGRLCAALIGSPRHVRRAMNSRQDVPP
ncbi:MAG: nitronate monooxygenase, partial [Acidimicrobiia bacterium]|nr:nitronate monooxygenase [Acidimicrobiia bacterium]